MARHIDPAVVTSVAEAVAAVEVSSCAELVVEVRARSGSYAHADARFAGVVAFATLLFVLLSPWSFAPFWVAPDVLIAYGIGLLIARSSPAIRRWMTTARDRETKVHTYAKAAFVERGVANTQRETGLLLYMSMVERRIEVIADRGVLDAVPALEWNQLLDKLRSRAASPKMLVDVLRVLEPLLIRHLPARAGDRNELSNELRFVTE
jgi:putative membrane protein